VGHGVATVWCWGVWSRACGERVGEGRGHRVGGGNTCILCLQVGIIEKAELFKIVVDTISCKPRFAPVTLGFVLSPTCVLCACRWAS
jgi:hypothetical protein